ncbi:uncharacterized protein LOC143794423 [Ranitomeya variabilis]|uniref:uncharacterized protein LOC143794423 n=1 Tax=Ranitomeya variabilis TaxID=490064 RepID=UPI004056C11B
MTCTHSWGKAAHCIGRTLPDPPGENGQAKYKRFYRSGLREGDPFTEKWEGIDRHNLPCIFSQELSFSTKEKICVFQQTSHAWPLHNLSVEEDLPRSGSALFCKGRMNSLADDNLEIMKSHFPKLYCSSCHYEEFYLLIFRVLKVSKG